MAYSAISDIVDVKIFESITQETLQNRSVLVDSGVAVSTEVLNSIASQAGSVAELPFWNPVSDTVAPNKSNDDATDIASVNAITQGSQVTHKLFLNQLWGSSDLLASLALGKDPAQAIRDTLDAYWRLQLERYAIGAAVGVYLADTADMGLDISRQDAGDPGVNNLFSKTAYNTGLMLMAENFENISLMVVHPATYTRMLNQNEITTFVRPSDNMPIQLYGQTRVLVSSLMPTVPAGGGIAQKYYTALFGAGAIGYGQGTPKVPLEIIRDGKAGNGGGVEALASRKEWIVHPFGYKQDAPTTPADKVPKMRSAAEYAANVWTRVVDRRRVPISMIVHN